MRTGITASGVRQILGDILLAADVVVVMLHIINTTVRKTDYQKISATSSACAQFCCSSHGTTSRSRDTGNLTMPDRKEWKLG